MLIQSPTIARRLQQFLRLTNLPDSILGPEIVGVVVVEDLSQTGDQVRGCSAGTVVNAVAAEAPFFALIRIGPSGLDVVVNRLIFASSTAQNITVRRAAVIAGVTQVAGTFDDLDLPGRPTSFFGQDTAVGLPAGTDFQVYRIEANQPQVIEVNIRLGNDEIDPPGIGGIVIGGLTVNTDLIGGFGWVESEPRG